MPSLRWVVVAAVVLAALVVFLMKIGLIMRTGEESAVKPGHPVETYHEQVTSTYLRTKEKLRDIQKTREAQDDWSN